MSHEVVAEQSTGSAPAPRPMAPKYRAWPTYTIIALNVLVFGAMVASGVDPFKPTVESVVRWGANTARTTHGEWWRWFTSMWLHYGVIHIGMNMLALAQIGPIIERFVGRRGFVAAYIASGIAGSMLRTAVNPLVASAGASGAICGLYGVLFAFVVRHRKTLDPQVKQALTRSVRTFVVYNAVFGVAVAGIDMMAHAGGLIGGFLAGLVVAAPKREGRTVRALAVVGLTTVVSAAGAFAIPTTFDFPGEYIKLGAVEKKTLPRYSEIVKSTQPDPEKADAIQREVLPAWEDTARVWTNHGRVPKDSRALADAFARAVTARVDFFKAMIALGRTGTPAARAEVDQKGRALEESMAAIKALDATAQKR